MSRVICNAGPIIGLIGLGKLHLLWELFGEIVISEAVHQEICTPSHRSDADIINNAIGNGHIKVIKVGSQGMIESMIGKLHRGELETILGAKTDSDIRYAVIDEKAARAFAATMLVDTIGILGVLRQAKTKGLIETVKPQMDKLVQNGYRISNVLYEQVLRAEKEI